MKTRSTKMKTLWGLLGALVLAVAAPPAGHAMWNGFDAKHIILIISDGMQFEHEIAASRYLTGRDNRLSFHSFPYRTSVATWDVTTYNNYGKLPEYVAAPYDPSAIIPMVGYDVERGGKRPYPWQKFGIEDTYFIPGGVKPNATDSASAATAWATGYKTDDGNLAWRPGDPADGALKTIAEILREKRGFAVGVVSSVPFTHATPAAHVSHNTSRSKYHDIGKEILTVVKPEVVIGGGYQAGSSCANPLSSTYISAADYDAVCKDLDYTVVTRAAGVDGGIALLEAAKKAAKNGNKLFGLFGGTGGNFEPPVPTDDGTAVVNRATIENPLLKDASLAALKVLSKNKNGFFLMIEQGDVDWANHANDYKWMIGTMWDLDETVKAVVDFVDRPGDDIHWWNTLVIVTADHSNSFMRLADGMRLKKGDLPAQVAGGVCPDPSGANCPAYPGGEVTYGTTNHTNELVTLYAMGGGNMMKHLRKFEGSWYPCTRIIDNTQLFHAMTDAAGVNEPAPLNVIVERPARCFNFFGDKN